MGKMATLGKMLDCFSVNPCRTSMEEDEEEAEQLPLLTMDNDGGTKLQKRVNDIIVADHQTLAFQLKPKMVVLRVSMHCNGCARKVAKHISKIDGVNKYKIDLESKMVMVIGDIMPLEVVESVCKVKNAVLWTDP